MYRASFMSIKVVIDLHPYILWVTDNIQQRAWGIHHWVHRWKTSCSEGIWVHPVPCLQIPSFHCPQEEKLVQTVSLFFSCLSGLGCCLVGVPHLSERTNDFGYQCELWNDYFCLWSPVFLLAGVADMQLLPAVLVFYTVLVLCLISQMWNRLYKPGPELELLC